MQKRGSGARKIENFVVLPEGGAQNRPGTRFIAHTKEDEAVALIPFVFNDSQTYVIEFGDLYVRFYSMGGVVLNAGVPYEVATPYAVADVYELDYAQSGDVLTLTHRNYPPMELKRFGHTNWTITELDVTRATAAPTALVFDGYVGTDSDVTHIAKEWAWVVTAVGTDESLPSAILEPPTTTPTDPALPAGKYAVLYGDKPATMTWTASATVGVTEYNVYRGRNGVFGFVGTTPGLTFHDDGDVPDYGLTPPQARDPFDGTGNYPSAVTFHGGRRVFGGSLENPQRIDGSKPGDYSNFDFSFPSQEDDSYQFTLAAEKADDIRFLASISSLVPLTASSIFRVTGATDDGPITPSQIQARRQAGVGSARVKPQIAGRSLLAVDARSASVQDIHFEFQADGFNAEDLSVLARHLFKGFSIVSATFATQPVPVLWAVRSDGVLLGLTYLRQHEVWAWHRHTTEGTFEAVCAIPEGSEDAVYVVVNRAGGRYVERFTTRLVTDPVEGVFLDSSLSYNGRQDGSVSLTVTAAEWTLDELATVTASASQWTPADVGKHVVFPGPVRLCIEEYVSPTVASARQDSVVPVAFQGVPVADWDLAVSRVSGLDHLIGQTVGILGDGDYQGVTVVAADGSISIQDPAAVVHVGLQYVPELEPLDLDVADQPIRDKRKTISKAYVLVESTRGLWAGEDREHMYAYPQRRISDGYEGPIPLETDMFEVSFTGTWNNHGRMVIQQRVPLPCTILAIIPEVSFGGS